MNCLSIAKLGPDKAAREAAAFLKAGEVIVSATDTIYGLLGLWSAPEVLERIYRLKRRSPDKKLIALAADRAAADALGEVPVPGSLASLWPGPLTVVRKAPAEHPLGWESQAVRVPDDPFLQALLAILNEPLVAPSANIEGEEPLQSCAEAREIFGELPLFVEGERPPASEPSTVLRIDQDNVELLRPGVLAVPGLVVAGDRIPVGETKKNWL